MIYTKGMENEILKFIEDNEILSFDTETTGLNVRKDRIMGFGISSNSVSYYIPLLDWDVRSSKVDFVDTPDDFIKQVLQSLSTKKLITWNASFDLRITKNNLGADLISALYADVLLLKHTVDEEMPFGLKEVASKIFGADVKKEKEEMQESIKRNGGSAKEYYKAATELLGKYCEQDCLLTFRLFEHYSHSLHAQGLEDFYYRSEVLPLYREVTIPMESRGIRLDLPLLNKTLVDIDQDLVKLEKSIQASIYPHLDIFTKWFLNKDYPLQTFTGKVPAWAKKHKTQLEAFKAENSGYMFNLLSKHHLKKLFFDTLKETPLSTTPTGLPQVDEDFLASIAPKYVWVEKLIQFNKLTKIKGTYIERFLEEQEDGRFYPSFQQHRTISGRYGSNLQQLPRAVSGDDVVSKYTSLVRKFFIADEGSVFIDTDYESLEPHIFAHVSGDPALINIFESGLDFYSEIAIRTEKYTEYSSDKSAPNYLGKLNKAARQKAKSYALGIPYGMTDYKLQFEINVSQEQASTLIEDYLNAFPELHKWMLYSKEYLYKHGYIKSEAGRIRHMPRAKQIKEVYPFDISNSLNLWKRFNEQPALYQKMKQVRKELINYENNSRNFQIQSLAASIVNRAAISLNRYFRLNNIDALVVAQVHDQLVVSLRDLTKKDVVKSEIQRIMETVMQLKVKLKAPPTEGVNLAESH